MDSTFYERTILLFQVGLESNIRRMLTVGPQAFLVAIVGVIVPFLLGSFVVGPLLLPELSFNAHLFVGAILTATSVGITARVFHDLGQLKTPEAQIILGAAVIDDVLGLTILAVVKAMVESGRVSLIDIAWITAKAVLFLSGAIFLGQLLAPRLGQLFSKINPGIGMKLFLAVSFGLIFAAMGKALGVFPDDIYSMMVIVIVFTTILPPPILNAFLKRQDPTLCAEDLKT